MRFTHLSHFLWAIFVAVLLAMPTGVRADKNKNTNASSPPPKQAPAQRPAAQPQRPATQTNRAPATTQRPGTNTAKPGTTTARPGNAGATRPGTTPGARPGTTTTARPGTTVRSTTVTTTRTTTVPRVPQRTIRDVGGHRVGYDAGGHVRTIQTRSGATVYRGAHGGYRVVRELPGGRRVVFAGRNYGHMERAYVRGYRMRTYYEHGVYRAVVYRPYAWGGRSYYIYAPAYYYRPAYYGWAYSAWGRPVYYQWGWAGNPWYGYYGGYFAPAPFYPGADLWLADYILAENLKMAYDAQQNAAEGVPAAGSVPEYNDKLTPEVKQMIAEEVKQQLMAEKAAAGVGSPASPETPTSAPPALDPNRTVFVVSSSLDVAIPTGDCELTAGDVINRIDDTPDSGGLVQVRVAASKQGDCAQGSKPSVQVADLQDMSNQFREKLDSGLQELAANSGKNGLPAAPDTSTSAAPDVPTPAPDKDVYAQMQGLQKEADQAQQDVNRQSASGVGGN